MLPNRTVTLEEKLARRIEDWTWESGQGPLDPFKDENLPDYTVFKSDYVNVMTKDLSIWREQFEMLTLFAAVVLKNANPTPMDLIAYLMENNANKTNQDRK